jgi:mono/diheme cytochrome c family protein
MEDRPLRRALAVTFALLVAGAGAAWIATAPPRAAALAEAPPGDPARGEAVFWAGGCASCHSAEGAQNEARLVLSGGRRFPSDFGTFVAPNISPHPDAGIGRWSHADFVHAMRNGVSPDGRHYYPAFPYTAYARMTGADMDDLWAFMGTLPSDATASAPHEVGFPFSIRRGVGAWKLLFAEEGWAVGGELSPEATRGRYLAEALAHCGECHTPRGAFGQLVTARWLSGAANPSGEGRIPDITPSRLRWSDNELVGYFRTGFTPDFDSAGGHMAEVVRNLSQLPEEDLRALVAYLRVVPPSAP